ncbi:Protein transport protein SFT2 [Halotydeus destructor]|nr:Protein transport protein SFT2 [Halotydeus destructor]
MSTTVNIGDDLKSYLSTSQSKKNGLSSFLGSGSNKVSGFFYKPLSTADDDINVDADSGSSSYFSWIKRSEPEPDSCLPSLTRTQRIIGFALCVGMGIVCFCFASFYIPFLILKARKFALLFTLGSCFVLLSFSFLWGPWNHMKHLFSKDRLPFTASYLATLTGTLYFAIHLQNTILTCIFAIAQVVALIWYVVSYVPGGQSGLWFFSKVIVGSASKLPV